MPREYDFAYDSGMAGPTGKFPKGKPAADDRGELDMAMAVDHARGLLVMDFGTPVVWLAMTKAEALDCARAIEKKAAEL
jgi:hypothetical protein